jgi:hypothetical protein
VSEAAEYVVNVEAGRARLKGVMRLESVESYARIFLPLRAALSGATGAFELDTSELVFLNSSGIRALGEFVLFARAEHKSLLISGAAASPWQRKTFSSLQKVHDQLEVRLR